MHTLCFAHITPASRPRPYTPSHPLILQYYSTLCTYYAYAVHVPCMHELQAMREAVRAAEGRAVAAEALLGQAHVCAI